MQHCWMLSFAYCTLLRHSFRLCPHFRHPRQRPAFFANSCLSLTAMAINTLQSSSLWKSLQAWHLGCSWLGFMVPVLCVFVMFAGLTGTVFVSDINTCTVPGRLCLSCCLRTDLSLMTSLFMRNGFSAIRACFRMN